LTGTCGTDRINFWPRSARPWSCFSTFDFIRDIKIGLSQGRVRAGAYGGLARRTYRVLGNEVNTVPRLMGQAEPGQIIVSPHVAEAVANRYHLKQVGQVALKGKTVPLTR
jgi:class 3 adenylate cyclase